MDEDNEDVMEEAELEPQDPVVSDATIADVGDILVEGLGTLLEGAAEDIAAFANQIAADGLMAAALGRQDVIDELKAQVRMMGEELRLQSTNSGWRMAANLIYTSFSLLAKVRV